MQFGHLFMIPTQAVQWKVTLSCFTHLQYLRLHKEAFIAAKYNLEFVDTIGRQKDSNYNRPS